ncbi:MAG: hypothetical protein N2171_06770 [Clostridia bacterium]|nr:hypothetical protein [Clostridia bacterium]
MKIKLSILKFVMIFLFFLSGTAYAEETNPNASYPIETTIENYTYADDKLCVDLSVANEEKKAAEVFIAVFDGENRLAGVSIEHIEESTDVTETLDLPSLQDENYTLKIFVWNQTPLAEVKSQKIKLTQPQYGIKYSLNANTSSCKRIGNAAGLSASPSVGDIEGKSDFSSIYPWSEIKLCNVKKDSIGNTKITYSNEDGFALDGSNGEVMVEIPKHYFKRYRKGGYEYIYISPTEQDGFVLDPVFIDGDKVLDKVYIGAYEGSFENGKLRSISGVQPCTTLSLDELKTAAAANGLGFQEVGFRDIWVLQRLYMVEYADRDSQTTIGDGLTGLVWPILSAERYKSRLTEKGTNRIVIKTYAASEFDVGDIVAITHIGATYDVVADVEIYNKEKFDNQFTSIYLRNLDGSPVSFDTIGTDTVSTSTGADVIYHRTQRTGKADAVSGNTGRENGIRNNKSAIKYRYVENLWGNSWAMLADGYIDNLTFKLSTDITKYNDEESFKPCSCTVPLQDKLGVQGNKSEWVYFVKNMGYDEKNPAVMLPAELGEGAEYTKHFSDIFFSYTGKRYFAYGGGYDHDKRAGIFCYRAWYDKNVAGPPLHGGRLIYKPI